MSQEEIFLNELSIRFKFKEIFNKLNLCVSILREIFGVAQRHCTVTSRETVICLGKVLMLFAAFSTTPAPSDGQVKVPGVSWRWHCGTLMMNTSRMNEESVLSVY